MGEILWMFNSSRWHQIYLHRLGRTVHSLHGARIATGAVSVCPARGHSVIPMADGATQRRPIWSSRWLGIGRIIPLIEREPGDRQAVIPRLT